MNEVELILTHLLNCSRAKLYLKKFSLDEENSFEFNLILKRRREGYPLAYLLGGIEFFGLNFKVREGVFIPRQETEILVEKVLDMFRKLESLKAQNLKILDMGTGCGNIAISLAKFLPNARIIATDISSSALKIAKENAIRNEVEERIEFIQADLFPNIPHTPYSILDAIVSNPPYIPTKDIEFLPKEVQFEPKISLDGGSDGLDSYHRIVTQSPFYLKEKGLLVMEMGFGQCEKIKKIFQNSDFNIVDIVRDYNKIKRVIVAQIK